MNSCLAYWRFKVNGLTHFDADGNPVMVDVSGKAETQRTALATGKISMTEQTFNIALSRDGKKGDAIAIAELAGIMAAKRTSELIPLCHPLPLTHVTVRISPGENYSLNVSAKVKTSGPTGVEMEALTAASTACLTLYDMLKAVDKSMVISDIKLLEKTGGSSGHYIRETE